MNNILDASDQPSKYCVIHMHNKSFILLENFIKMNQGSQDIASSLQLKTRKRRNDITQVNGVKSPHNPVISTTITTHKNK